MPGPKEYINYVQINLGNQKYLLLDVMHYFQGKF